MTVFIIFISNFITLSHWQKRFFSISFFCLLEIEFWILSLESLIYNLLFYCFFGFIFLGLQPEKCSSQKIPQHPHYLSLSLSPSLSLSLSFLSPSFSLSHKYSFRHAQVHSFFTFHTHTHIFSLSNIYGEHVNTLSLSQTYTTLNVHTHTFSHLPQSLYLQHLSLTFGSSFQNCKVFGFSNFPLRFHCEQFVSFL